MQTSRRIPKALAVAVLVLGSAGGGIAGCGRLEDSGSMFSTGYALNVSVVEVDSRRVPCIVARGESSVALSCDWDAVAP